MNSNLTYETVKINKVIFNKNLEQTINYEYQLPDYYTGIFKVLKFDLEPHISSCRASNKEFVIDGNAIMKLMYIDEEEGDIKSINQNIPFSKTINLEEEITNYVPFYNVKVNYKNCKIVSPKKLDLKATLTISLKIESSKEESLIKNSNKSSLQFKYWPICVTSNQMFVSQQFNINEQIEFENIAKEILDIRINIFEDELKIISNKIIAKSIANIEILYISDEKNNFITQKVSIPVNNMIDISEINEKYLYSIKYDVISTSFEVLQEGKSLKLEAEAIASAHSSVTEDIEVVVDSFSTKYEVKPITKDLNFSTIISNLDEKIKLSQTIKNINLVKLLDLTANISELNCMQTDKKLECTLKLNVTAIGLNKEDIIESFNKTIPIEFKINNKEIDNNLTKTNINDIKIIDILPTLGEDGVLDFKATINVKGFIFINGNIKILENININEDKPKEKSSAALTLYYPKYKEQIWDIAKNFSTSAKNIMEDNKLDCDYIKDEIMIIIPIL